ncbi:MAG: SAM-dependent chlorinase/fluorinase [Chlorobiaceae bacterium]
MPRPVIILMTDFGLTDTYVGQMKGVILSLAPSALIIDLTHSVTPQNIVQGAFLLSKSAGFFPEGSIFISVVDPGVGTARKAIALETEHAIFLAPDNGLLTAIFQLQKIKHCIHITESRYMLPVQSSTFHGRDIFSPVAAHLASGVPIQDIGREINCDTCKKIPMPTCQTSDHGKSWEGSIIYTDNFGNLITSLEAEQFDQQEQWIVTTETGMKIPLLVTYSDVANQQPLAYSGSAGMIEIAVRNGNAAETFGLQNGDRVTISRSF